MDRKMVAKELLAVAKELVGVSSIDMSHSKDALLGINKAKVLLHSARTSLMLYRIGSGDGRAEPVEDFLKETEYKLDLYGASKVSALRLSRDRNES